ncbi:Nif11-like leader peptide family natural product precursor [Synechococcus sp. NOUM97013]|uniref:Nif11-like leader peptide family natural product precursor n=1 Tax=Synechococcus sp. NOUM97013 TaxID=1442555 RepID=UPI00164900FC|nr:Nif11-like leader peptide family natural product precursor [Synechococcus sp. NOUM97013]QNI73751.1 nif11-like leader peptide domain protein [Synechococcus sp. NOUM97013]
MPDEQFQAFLKTAQSDPSLQRALREATSSDEVITLAQEAGFTIQADFTTTPSPLSDEELEGIDGGNCVTASWFKI